MTEDYSTVILDCPHTAGTVEDSADGYITATGYASVQYPTRQEVTYLVGCFLDADEINEVAGYYPSTYEALASLLENCDLEYFDQSGTGNGPFIVGKVLSSFEEDEADTMIKTSINKLTKIGAAVRHKLTKIGFSEGLKISAIYYYPNN